MTAKERALLIKYRDWLINSVIPGFHGQPYGEESIQRAVQQLNEINEKLRKIQYPRKKGKTK